MPVVQESNLCHKIEIDEPFHLAIEDILFFQKNGYIKLKNVFSSKVLNHYKNEISCNVRKLNTQVTPLDERTVYEKAFLQIFNLWTQSPIAKEFVFGKRLARIATQLMGTRGVRLYHDQALFKEEGGGITPWHADQYYWPLSSDKTVTAWIPLQATPLEMGPLAFAPGSQHITLGRELEIGEESETLVKKNLREYLVDETPFDLGEVSFHSGWVFHRAGINQTNQTREVMTVIYVDEDIRLAEAKNKNQILDREKWCPGLQVGDVLGSVLNPIIYSER